MQKWSDDMASYFDRLEVVDPQVFEKSDSDTVIVYSTLKLRVRKNGEDWVKPLIQVSRVSLDAERKSLTSIQAVKVDRGKGFLTEIRPFYWDVKGLNEALSK